MRRGEKWQKVINAFAQRVALPCLSGRSANEDPPQSPDLSVAGPGFRHL